VIDPRIISLLDLLAELPVTTMTVLFVRDFPDAEATLRLWASSRNVRCIDTVHLLERHRYRELRVVHPRRQYDELISLQWNLEPLEVPYGVDAWRPTDEGTL
jgi:hypothetical protein